MGQMGTLSHGARNGIWRQGLRTPLSVTFPSGVQVPKSASPLRFSLGLSSPLGIDPSLPTGHLTPARQGPLGTDWMEEASFHQSVTLLNTVVSVPQFPEEV